VEPYSLWPILGAFLLAWLLCSVSGANGAPMDPGRRSGFDGLRGYLAFCVFLHHASFYVEFAHAGEWIEPASRVYSHLGDSSVKLFFMITAFLFYSKLLRAQAGPGRDFDWVGLFAGRFCRIVPMYWLAISVMFVIVAFVTGFHLREPAYRLLAKAANWLTFFFTTQPDMNGVKATRLIFSGVMWTLGVEWMFYLFLPILGLFLGVKVSRPILALALIPCVWLAAYVGFRTQPTLVAIVPFIGGVLAAYVNQSRRWTSRLQGRVASAVAITAFGLNVVLTPNGHNFITPIFLAIGFIPIACGNSLFGLLDLKAARFLGEISFSIYILHGMVLYVTFCMVLPHFTIERLSPQAHWAVVLGLVPVLMGLSALTFKNVEAKWLRAAPRLAQALRRIAMLRKGGVVTQ